MARLIIIFGIILFIVGIYAEFALTSWAKFVLISGTIITYLAVALWLLSSENRVKLRQKMPLMTSTSIGDITIGPTENQKGRIRRAGAPYYSVMSFCAMMAMLHIMTLLIHKSPLYHTTIELLKTNEEILARVGEAKDYSYVALGKIQETGSSYIILGIKGADKTLWVEAAFQSVNNVHTLEKITPIASADGLFGK